MPLFVFAQNDGISSFKISKIGPIINKDLTITSYDTTVDFVYCFQDLRLYSRLISVDENIFGKLVSNGWNERVFVHQSDSLYGYVTDTLMCLFKVRMHIDSGSLAKSYFNNAIENDFKRLNILPIKKHVAISESEYQDIYFVIDRNDTVVNSKWTLTFSDQLKKIPISISTYMDSISSSKLVEIRTDEPERFIKSYNKTIPQFYFIFRFEPYLDFDSKRIRKYFDDYLTIINRHIYSSNK